jgi:hypothetical protein
MKKIPAINMAAGFSFIGFAAVSILADRVKLGPVASQVAGFTGAFLGGLAANHRSRRKTHALQSDSAQRPQIPAADQSLDRVTDPSRDAGMSPPVSIR